MRKEEAGVLAAIVIIVVISAVIVVGPWNRGQNPFFNPVESLPHIEAPVEIPEEQVNATEFENLTMSVTGFFHTMSPHSSPTTFGFSLDIIVNNTGMIEVDDFQVLKVTIFYENATPVYTFGVVPSGNTTINGSSVVTLHRQNDGDMTSVPYHLLTATQVFARVLVTFNGKSFDMTMIRDRSAFYGIELPNPCPPNLDLLHECRRHWRKDLPNCRLQTIEQAVCGRRRVGDIPGAAIPDAYHRYVDTGDARQLRDILHHNLLDLLTMAQILCAILTGRDVEPPVM